VFTYFCLSKSILNADFIAMIAIVREFYARFEWDGFKLAMKFPRHAGTAN